MASQDITRHLFRPANHYTGMRVQQRRPILDSDINEGEMLDDEGHRLLALDVVGPHGSSDLGFTVGAVNILNYDFAILNGSYHLGGLRFEIAGDSAGPQRLRKQLNWLQSHNVPPVLPTPPLAVPRWDLVYLIGWEQAVSAVEDRELQEQALGGPDTIARLRRMHRVAVRPGAPGPADCVPAFTALVADLKAGGHTFDAASHELKSAARLTVVESEPDDDSDLCTPPLQRGYTASENQAIRVQLIDSDRFLWSRDNAAPLYRIKLPFGGDTLTVTFLTPPRDHAHYPTVGQVLEILPWGAELANGERTADFPIADGVGGGVLARVTQAYDPTTNQVMVTAEDPNRLLDMIYWFGRNSIPQSQHCFYVRVWNPGDHAPPGSFGVPIQPGVDIPLTGTGLKIRFNQNGIVGDHWILAARPATPHTVVPWDLHSGAAPHGPRRFYCPLAMVHWSPITSALGVPASTGSKAEVHSCRQTFRPLTHQSGCCTVSVGDGVTSHGDFTKIADALAALHPDQPARICIRPGEYKERVVLDGRRDLVIEGCGPATVLKSPDDNDTSQGLITILSASDITLRDLAIEAAGQFGVMILGTAAACERIALERLKITTRRDPDGSPSISSLWIPTSAAPFPLSTIAAYKVRDLRIDRCALTMVGDLSAAANLFIRTCTDALVRDCRIFTPIGAGTIPLAWGGVHVSDGCTRVRLERNEIRDGLGYGITLGGVATASGPTDYRGWLDPGGRFVLVDGTPNPGAGGSLPATAAPPGGGDLVNLRISLESKDLQIVGNHISQVGSSPISVLGFRSAPPAPSDAYEMLSTPQLLIRDNILENSYLRPTENGPATVYAGVVAFGGIVLAHAQDLRVHNNLIRSNSAPGANRPVCGIYVLFGDNIWIEDNQIRDNGARVEGAVSPGLRAGIALQQVGRRVTGGLDITEDRLLPAARVRGNVVIQPTGRALQIYGLGPMMIQGNFLVGQGFGPGASSSTAHCVEILNLGQSPELVQLEAIPTELFFAGAPPHVYIPTEDEMIFVDGRILFSDNQVRFELADELTSVGQITRMNSYGDIAVLDNQFVTILPEKVTLTCDTKIVAWSTRTANNRWEDPIGELEDEDDDPLTARSLWTIAAMNITAFNQASSCIHADIVTFPVIAGTEFTNPYARNQTYIECDD